MQAGHPSAPTPACVHARARARRARTQHILTTATSPHEGGAHRIDVSIAHSGHGDERPPERARDRLEIVLVLAALLERKDRRRKDDHGDCHLGGARTVAVPAMVDGHRAMQATHARERRTRAAEGQESRAKDAQSHPGAMAARGRRGAASHHEDQHEEDLGALRHGGRHHAHARR